MLTKKRLTMQLLLSILSKVNIIVDGLFNCPIIYPLHNGLATSS
jgi:hypothetical protein